MRILNKSIHIINYEEGTISYREIPDAFNDYVNELISHINTNASVRDYKSRSMTTQVVNDIKNIILSYEDNNQVVGELTYDIANRLLRKEVEVQGNITRLNVSIQKGSLIQALLYDESTNEHTYLLAKVEHSDFVDEVDFSFKSGYSKDKKTIWKSCFLYGVNWDSVEAVHAKIYSNTVAKYWFDDFLELDQMITDETNTLRAFKAIDETLTRNVKKQAPQDYTVIRNSVIAYFKGNDHLDYDNMINSILGEYQSDELNADGLASLKEKLMSLPESKRFDHQFNPVPSVVNARIKKVYSVNNGIEIKITDSIDNIKETIKSYEEIDGTRYIRIKTNNEETYNFFK